ncbi:glycoside hydrolase superfamily [Catenaria anguillulae PL171]|uniref:Chitinase domain-containing protein 1 n=1 Tax=Catenaria anguillulae PL171 TaxID=765915 RepID=A0A1Y2HUD7_9FUNG|nr:glycoside hydrolase superfamily [Catenaria anguillulae PL171]
MHPMHLHHRLAAAVLLVCLASTAAVVSSAVSRARVPILVYVTPWNAEGYVRTLTHAANLTHVSPTWHAIRPLPAAGSFEVTTQTDRNLTWLAAISADSGNLSTSDPTAHRPKVVPRVTLDADAWTQPDYIALVQGQQGHTGQQFVQVLVAACQAFGYDGFVLEVTALLDYLGPLLHRITSAFAKHNLTFILVAPPAPLPGDPLAPQLPKGLDPAVAASLGPASLVGVSLMTYDYSSHRGKVGPNAPLDWVDFNLNRLCPPTSSTCSPTILIGVHFFGMRATYSPTTHTPMSFDPILGRDLVSLSRASTAHVSWDAHAHERVLTLDEGATKVWYPSRRSLRARLRLCHARQACGFAVWEGGQGTDELWDALFSL